MKEGYNLNSLKDMKIYSYFMKLFQIQLIKFDKVESFLTYVSDKTHYPLILNLTLLSILMNK